MIRRLIILLLIVGCVFAQSKELSIEYKYKYFIGTYPIWHNKDISGVDAPFNFVFNIRLDKPFGFGFEYVKSENDEETYHSTWKKFMPLFSYEIKTESNKFILELLLGAELTKVDWEIKDSTDKGSTSEWSGIYGCRLLYNVKNKFYVGMIGMLSEDWVRLFPVSYPDILSSTGLSIRPDFGIYYMF